MSRLLCLSSQQQQLLYTWTLLQVLACFSFTSCVKAGDFHYENNITDTNIIYLLSLLPHHSCTSEDGNPLQRVGDMGTGALSAAAELAIQHINQDTKTLNDYKVELIHADGGCNDTTWALISFVEHVFYNCYRRRPIAGIIGPTCFQSTIALSSVTGRGGVALPIVHIASSAELEDRDNFPYAFGIAGSRFEIVKALFSLIRHNHWNSVAILYDDTRESFHDSRRLMERIENELPNKLITFSSVVSNTFFPLDSLHNSGARIVAVLTTLTLAHKTLCIAYHDSMVFPEYQWIIGGHRLSEFLERNTSLHYNGKQYQCNWSTNSMKNVALEFTLFMHLRLVVENKTTPLVSGHTYATFEQQYSENSNDHNGVCPSKVDVNVRIAAVYDAVWALALAINSTMDSPDNSDDILIDELFDVDFAGASGHIQFDKNSGFVQRFIDIVQIHNGTTIPAGQIFMGNVSLSNDPRITFINIQPRYATINQFLTAFSVLVETFLLLVTATVHIVYLINRKYPSIKASSPSLNHLVFLGCYMWGIIAIVFVLILKALGLPDFIFIGNTCHALLVWMIPIALTLTFGTLMAKTWRIYRIFIHFTEPGPLISNKALVMIVLVQLGIDAVIGTAWSIVSPMRLETIEGGSYIDESGETIVPRMCAYPNAEIFLPTIVGYKILQITLLFILCVMTRSVKIRNFNTVSLRMGSYLCLCLNAVLLPLYGILWYTNAEIHADVIVFCVYFGATGFVLLVFVLLPPALPCFKKRHVSQTFIGKRFTLKKKTIRV